MSPTETEALAYAKERVTLIQSFPENRMFKVLLRHEDGMGEGIWATADEENWKKYKNDKSRGEFFFAYLCNMPLGWAGCCWGSKIKCKTLGADRPTALVADQNGVEDNKKLFLGLSLYQKELDSKTNKN